MKEILKFLPILLVLLIPTITHADIVQSTSDQYQSVNGSNQNTNFWLFQPLGNNLNGTPERIYMEYRTHGSSAPHTQSVYFYSCTDNTYATCTALNGGTKISTTTLSDTSSKSPFYIDLSTTTIAFTNGTYYGYSTESSVLLHLYGSTATSSGPTTRALSTPSSSPCSGGNCGSNQGIDRIKQLSFNLIINPTAISGLPNITWTHPTHLASTTSGSNYLAFDYTIPTGYTADYYILTLKDITSGIATTTFRVNTTLPTSGSGSVSRNVTLQSGHLYQASVTLYDNSIAGRNYDQPIITFSAGTDYIDTFFNTFGTDGGFAGTSQCPTPSDILDVGGGILWAFCKALVPDPRVIDTFLSLPAWLTEQFPFSWISAAGDMVDSFSTQSATSTAAVSFDFPLGAEYNGSSTFTFMNPSDLTTAVPLITTMRQYIAYIMYAVFGFMAFRGLYKLL